MEGRKMHQQRGNLMLVDGEVPRAERMAKRLDHLGFDIQLVENGATALLQAHETRPDVIITAAELPILDGYRMLEALRSKQETCALPVLLITDGSSHEEIARGWMAGADLCIPRNQGEADVLATLHRALSNGLVRSKDRGSAHLAEESPDVSLVS